MIVAKKKMSIALAPSIPVIGVVVGAVESQGFSANALNEIGMRMTGYNYISRTFDVDSAKAFWFGEAAGIVANKVATKTGLNRKLGDFTESIIGVRITI